jgi:hypothetical protein
MTTAKKLLLGLVAVIPDGERSATFSRKTGWWSYRSYTRSASPPATKAIWQ